jgi:hypothetical protein
MTNTLRACIAAVLLTPMLGGRAAGQYELPLASPQTARAAPVAGEETRDLSVSAAQGIVILRNGQVLEGQVSRVGDLYYIAMPTGEIRLKASDVEVSCRDLEEGYQRKRAMLPFQTAIEHLKLAYWCQKHGLTDHAATEIAEAKRLEPQHPMLAMIEHRQEAAVDTAPAAPPMMPTDGGVPQEELDRMVRQMPAGTVETFTQTIQPLLVNNCLTAGCHGPQSESKFRLLRTPHGQPAGRRLTQRNLHATLAWLDAESPDETSLIKSALTPHGGMKVAPFSEHQTGQQLRFFEWIHQVSSQPTVPTGYNLAAANKSPSAPAAAPPAEPARLPVFDSAVTPAAYTEPAKETPPRPLPAGEANLQPGSFEDTFKVPSNQPVLTPDMFDRGVKRGATIMPFAPADPFDAEAFNRRYFPKKNAAPAPSIPAKSLPASIVPFSERGE